MESQYISYTADRQFPALGVCRRNDIIRPFPETADYTSLFQCSIRRIQGHPCYTVPPGNRPPDTSFYFCILLPVELILKHIFSVIPQKYQHKDEQTDNNIPDRQPRHPFFLLFEPHSQFPHSYPSVLTCDTALSQPSSRLSRSVLSICGRNLRSSCQFALISSLFL